MREIKFKIWSQFQGGKMILPNEIGFYEKSFLDDNGYWQTSSLHSLLKREDVKVMQYSGLKDKNGRDIYEGDIVSTDLTRPFLIVEFRNGAFVYQCQDNGNDYYDTMTRIDSIIIDKCLYHEVIGNVYENPELLEVK